MFRAFRHSSRGGGGGGGGAPHRGRVGGLGRGGLGRGGGRLQAHPRSRQQYAHGTLRNIVHAERAYESVRAPLCGIATSLGARRGYQRLGNHTDAPCGAGGTCAIARPLCDLLDPALGGYPQLYGNTPETFGPGDHGGRGSHYGRAGCASGSCGGDGVGYNYYGRGGAGGWQQVGYMLPLHIDPARQHGRGARRCTCAMLRRQRRPSNRPTSNWGRGGLRQPSQFSGGGGGVHEPYDDYNDGGHEPNCPLSAHYDQTTADGHDHPRHVRRYHLYVRIDPDRLGQRCLYTSARRGDHRYNNCRYLQFGVSQEGVHDSAIMILSRDFLIGGRSNNAQFASTGATRCIEDGDVLFVPGERNQKFRVHLYDDRIYDGNCFGNCG